MNIVPWHMLSFLSAQDPAHRMIPSTFRVGLPTVLIQVEKLPHKYAQRSACIQDPAKLTFNISHTGTLIAEGCIGVLLISSVKKIGCGSVVQSLRITQEAMVLIPRKKETKPVLRQEDNANCIC